MFKGIITINVNNINRHNKMTILIIFLINKIIEDKITRVITNDKNNKIFSINDGIIAIRIKTKNNKN
jgi:hypothetical protein